MEVFTLVRSLKNLLSKLPRSNLLPRLFTWAKTLENITDQGNFSCSGMIFGSRVIRHVKNECGKPKCVCDQETTRIIDDHSFLTKYDLRLSFLIYFHQNFFLWGFCILHVVWIIIIKIKESFSYPSFIRQNVLDLFASIVNNFKSTLLTIFAYNLIAKVQMALNKPLTRSNAGK